MRGLLSVFLIVVMSGAAFAQTPPRPEPRPGPDRPNPSGPPSSDGDDLVVVIPDVHEADTSVEEESDLTVTLPPIADPVVEAGDTTPKSAARVWRMLPVRIGRLYLYQDIRGGRVQSYKVQTRYLRLMVFNPDVAENAEIGVSCGPRISVRGDFGDRISVLPRESRVLTVLPDDDSGEYATCVIGADRPVIAGASIEDIVEDRPPDSDPLNSFGLMRDNRVSYWPMFPMTTVEE